MLNKIKHLFLFLALIFTPLTAFADISNILWEIYQVETQNLPNLKELENIQAYAEQTLQSLENNLQGNFGYGNLLNGNGDLIQRQWANNNWMDVLNMVNTDTNSAFYQAQKNYAQRYQVMDPNQFGNQQGVTALNKQYYSDSSQISRAALAASSYSYDQINQHIQNIHDILQKLEAQPSEKAAIDLNTRLVAEQSFIQLETLRMQNIQTQLTASHSQGEVNGLSSQASFMQWNS